MPEAATSQVLDESADSLFHTVNQSPLPKGYTMTTIERFTFNLASPIDTGDRPLFTLHLPTTDPAETWTQLAAIGSECLTGSVVGGDSWYQWCEPSRDDEHEAIHVDFTANNRAHAGLLGVVLASHVLADAAYVTGAFDWSEWEVSVA